MEHSHPRRSQQNGVVCVMVSEGCPVLYVKNDNDLCMKTTGWISKITCFHFTSFLCETSATGTLRASNTFTRVCSLDIFWPASRWLIQNLVNLPFSIPKRLIAKVQWLLLGIHPNQFYSNNAVVCSSNKPHKDVVWHNTHQFTPPQISTFIVRCVHCASAEIPFMEKKVYSQFLLTGHQLLRSSLLTHHWWVTRHWNCWSLSLRPI